MPTRHRLNYSLYVITDRSLAKGRDNVEVVQAALAGGANVIQLRDKSASALELYREGLRIKELTSLAGALFIMNDRLDLALAVNADGVHLGQEDLPLEAARKLLGNDKLIGLSVENPEQAAFAEASGASYVAIGPIYEARESKADAGPPVGPQAIAAIRKATRLPIVAIGGIKAHHIAEVIGAGADSIAVISAVVAAPNVKGAAADLSRRIASARRAYV
jgi:thiamine-phosphate diphosphorylase